MDFVMTAWSLVVDYYFKPLSWLGSMVGYAAGVLVPLYALHHLVTTEHVFREHVRHAAEVVAAYAALVGAYLWLG